MCVNVCVCMWAEARWGSFCSAICLSTSCCMTRFRFSIVNWVATLQLLPFDPDNLPAELPVCVCVCLLVLFSNASLCGHVYIYMCVCVWICLGSCFVWMCVFSNTLFWSKQRQKKSASAAFPIIFFKIMILLKDLESLQNRKQEARRWTALHSFTAHLFHLFQKKKLNQNLESNDSNDVYWTYFVLHLSISTIRDVCVAFCFWR